MKIRLLLAELIFWVHVIIVTVWLGLFFVPSSLWHDKIIFHFYLTLFVVIHQFIWGLAIMPWTHKFRMVCILTTPMQLLRGQKISDAKNYDQAWLKELVGKKGLTVPHGFSAAVTFSALFLVIYQYIFLR